MYNKDHLKEIIHVVWEIMRLMIPIILSAGTLKGEIYHTWPQFDNQLQGSLDVRRIYITQGSPNP